MIFRLAIKSLRNRWLTSALTLSSIALGVALFIGIERVRLGARESFSSAISQTDLIVGARGGSIPLLLYSVFHIGNATNNISYTSYLHFKNHPAVKWTIPYSMGDSHRGYRVVATDSSFYENYRFRGEQKLSFLEGHETKEIFDVVVGSDIARKLKYKVGDPIVLAHGASEGAAIFEHEDKPFVVVGVLKKTGTPIDRSLYITLEGMEAIHMDWKEGAPPLPGEEIKAQSLSKENIKISQITSFLLRSQSRIEALRLQREVLNFTEEPLMAIIPGVALGELWNGIGYAEEALRVVSVFVILAGILGLLVALLTSLNERRREMAILRVLGAGAKRIVALLMMEALILTTGGILLGLLIIYGALYAAQPIIESYFSLYIPISHLQEGDYFYLLLLLIISILISLIPGMKAYKNSLADGLSIKI